MEKKTLNVSVVASNKIYNARNIFEVLAFISFLIGIIVLLCGFVDSKFEWGITLGIVCLVGAFSTFIASILFGGLYPIVKANEIQNAIYAEKYDIVKIKDEDEDEE